MHIVDLLFGARAVSISVLLRRGCLHGHPTPSASALFETRREETSRSERHGTLQWHATNNVMLEG